MEISNAQNRIVCDKSAQDYFKQRQLPEGVLTFQEFCEQRNIDTGMLDCDINGTKMKQAQEQYNQYLQENGLEPEGSIFGAEKSGSDSKSPENPSIFVDM
jgi:hypothetical protein